MSSMEESSDREEIATYERISLNNLLLKSKGAPYEDALRRIIEVRLQQNSRALGSQVSSVNRIDTDPSSNLSSVKESSIQESYIPGPTPHSVSHQLDDKTQTFEDGDFKERFNDWRSEKEESSRCGSTSSSSKDEFQRWILRNNRLDLHYEDQVRYVTLGVSEKQFIYEILYTIFLVSSYRRNRCQFAICTSVPELPPQHFVYTEGICSLPPPQSDRDTRASPKS